MNLKDLLFRKKIVGQAANLKTQSAVEALGVIVKQLNAGEGGYVWDIITALRSCDKSTERQRLKELTTMRLRHIVGFTGERATEGQFRPGVRHWPLNTVEMVERNELLGYAPEHFAEHWYAAVTAVKRLYHYDLETEAKLEE